MSFFKKSWYRSGQVTTGRGEGGGGAYTVFPTNVLVVLLYQRDNEAAAVSYVIINLSF